MRKGNWYTSSNNCHPSKRTYFVFSHEKSGNVFRGYLDWNDGWYWEDRHGHRVGPFDTRDLCFEAFICFATGT